MLPYYLYTISVLHRPAPGPGYQTRQVFRETLGSYTLLFKPHRKAFKAALTVAEPVADHDTSSEYEKYIGV